MEDKRDNSYNQSIDAIKSLGVFSDFAILFADFIYDLSDVKPLELYFATLLLTDFCEKGHVCIEWTTKKKYQYTTLLSLDDFSDLAPISQWPQILSGCSVVGQPGEYCPLILNENLLYLYKYWNFESTVGETLYTLAKGSRTIVDPNLLNELLNSYFPGESGEVNWQGIGACIASVKNLCIITGGPGTGKTTTLVAVLALLTAYEKRKTPRIVLTAPTGKAAARIEESVNGAKKKFKRKGILVEGIPSKAVTIHRLLGSRPYSGYRKYTKDNPLPVDIVVIDEVSMIDLSLMAHVLDALPSKARLILSGDCDQLASIQVGSVFGDICKKECLSSFTKPFFSCLKSFSSLNFKETPPTIVPHILSDCMVALKKTYRFDASISTCCTAINKGDGEKALNCLLSSTRKNLSWMEFRGKDQLIKKIKNGVINGWTSYLKTTDIGEAFNLLNQFRTLCALQKGYSGVEEVNQIIEKILFEAELIQVRSEYYEKLPIMITKNDYRLNLYNGDTGIIGSDVSSPSSMKAWFPTIDKNGKSLFRSFSLSQIPQWVKSYAISIHKSQGSEFKSVQIVLPDISNPILTRELLYTAITRAKKNVSVYGPKEIFIEAVGRKITRVSGLRDKLYGE